MGSKSNESSSKIVFLHELLGLDGCSLVYQWINIHQPDHVMTLVPTEQHFLPVFYMTLFRLLGQKAVEGVPMLQHQVWTSNILPRNQRGSCIHEKLRRLTTSLLLPSIQLPQVCKTRNEHIFFVTSSSCIPLRDLLLLDWDDK